MASKWVSMVGTLLKWMVALSILAMAMAKAYGIRLFAVKTYGAVIHEFDPWFNYRATEYLAAHGSEKFFKWFDYMSWYPLGRPVGTTIYPGMQFTAVWIWQTLKMMPKYKLKAPELLRQAFPFVKAVLRFGPMSLNDVCVYIPAWFGSVATLGVFLLTREATRSLACSCISAMIMAIIPAHLMRSIAGGYDNESIAVSAICFTFYLWCRSLRSEKSWPIAILAGISYIYMVAAWGGYIFVINMIGVHAAALIPLRMFNSSTYKAYTLFFIIGTLGATRIPVVGWTPLKSLEQMGPFGVFITYQLLEFCNYRIRKHKDMSWSARVALRIKVFSVAFLILAAVVFALWPTGYFGPLSSRIRGLFVKHTRTGNPLVDSVAEHQAASDSAYWQYLHHCKTLSILGWFLCFWKTNPAKSFIVGYGLVASFFSLKMVRLLIICGPIASILTGVALGTIFDLCVSQVTDFLWFLAFGSSEEKKDALEDEASSTEPKSPEGKKTEKDKDKKGKKTAKKDNKDKDKDEDKDPQSPKEQYDKFWESTEGKALYRRTSPLRAMVAVVVLGFVAQTGRQPVVDFMEHAETMAQGMSSPQILFMTRNGQIVDDYKVTYEWLKKETPQDARVMAWWDYGYQITGIGNRTSIADGNTWNHEHIATLARCLVLPEKRAYKIIRHLADYVLVWAGGRGDDLAKSPHMCRIGTSVYPDISPNDPTCQQFGFYQDRTPTPMMAKSVIYKLHSHNKAPGAQVNPKYFKEVYSSKYGLVRIFKVLNISKESKEWVANPENKVCDAPGSWYCSGRYPKALQPLIAKRRDFAQLEDFNKGNREKNAYSRYVEEQNRRGGSI
uniref:dolichyl-diphosphooligosaccharide--protein glycotransferase n=1 Tax=Eutreptiella gymnastica TaxID=73025 RepID=A0A7S4LFI7_9EUGL